MQFKKNEISFIFSIVVFLKKLKFKNNYANVSYFDFYFLNEITNVLKTGPIIEHEKLSVHGSLVGPTVEPQLNR